MMEPTFYGSDFLSKDAEISSALSAYDETAGSSWAALTRTERQSSATSPPSRLRPTRSILPIGKTTRPVEG